MSELQVYIVSVWRSSGAAPEFRASARAVEDLEPRFFTSADELGRFLADAAAETERGRHDARCVAPGDPPTHQPRNLP